MLPCYYVVIVLFEIDKEVLSIRGFFLCGKARTAYEIT